MLAGTLMLALAPSAALLAGAPSASAATAPVHAAAAAASSRFASLAAIAVAPHSTTAFAFGRHGNATTSAPYALRHHGNRWSTLKMANPADSFVTAIAAGSKSRAWLVGTEFPSGGSQLPFIESLKGSRFTHTKTKKLGTGNLVAAAASSAKNAWAVGDTLTGTAKVAHFNGKKWSSVKVPGTMSELTAVSTTGKKNVWAITNVGGAPASAHFNGKKWSVTPIAAAGTNVTSIATTSSKKAVAVGYHFVIKGKTEVLRPLTFRLAHKKWTSSAAPFSLQGALLESVTVLGKHGYAVGENAAANQNSTPLVLRLSRGKWKSEHVAKRGHASSLVSVGMSSKFAAAAGQWAIHPQCTANSTPPHAFIESPHGSAWGQAVAPDAITTASRRC
jgi:hypothetical protein